MRTTCVIAGLLACLQSAPSTAFGAEPPLGQPGVALEDLPPVWCGRPEAGYKVDPYIRAAALQEMGRERAIDRLKAWAARDADKRVIVLCRMLFTARPGGEFRPPRLGVPNTL